ncbi:MAG: hypothetical protein N2115_06330 [bacterium]|nr:hypothetical protein [bacterium]
MPVNLFSAPEENYEEHINQCLVKLNIILPVFLPVLKRILNNTDEAEIKKAVEDMVRFHDLGKLTKRWQENVGKRYLPSHAPIGAGYLWKILVDSIREPVCFATAIHHTDKGLLSNNIERPDVQAILDKVVKLDGEIEWDEKSKDLSQILFPDIARNLTVEDLKDMARNMRNWARSGSFLEQHKKRSQAMLCHHILKLCDISAASERKEYKKADADEYYGGWLMSEEIQRYVDSLKKRNI